MLRSEQDRNESSATRISPGRRWCAGSMKPMAWPSRTMPWRVDGGGGAIGWNARVDMVFAFHGMVLWDNGCHQPVPQAHIPARFVHLMDGEDSGDLITLVDHVCP